MMPSMATIVITGANRGIGLELARQLTERGEEVIALCREGSRELQSLGVRIVEGVDVTDEGSVRASGHRGTGHASKVAISGACDPGVDMFVSGH